MSSNFRPPQHCVRQRHVEDQMAPLNESVQSAASSYGGYITTESVARAFGILAQSVRKRVSLTGTYFGLKPVKLPNRRLMWEADAVGRFLRGEEV